MQTIHNDQQQRAPTAPVRRKITEKDFIQNWGHFWYELDDAIFTCSDKVIKERKKDIDLLNKQHKKKTKANLENEQDNDTKSNLAKIFHILEKKIEDNEASDIHVDEKIAVPKQSSQLCTDKDGKDWCNLSSNPFDLYDFYVSEDDWNCYMNSLAADMKFKATLVPRLHSPYVAFLTTPSQEVEVVQGAYGAFLEATRPPKPADEEARVNHVKQLAGNLKLKSWHKHAHVADLDDNQIFKQCARGVRFQSSLNYRKIEVAAGERDPKYDQKAIMGNQSASKVASSLGWKHNNDLTFINEHDRYGINWKAAFTLQSIASSNYIFAPIPREATLIQKNIKEISYEKAWQNLFIFEHELKSLLEGRNPPAGQLWIRTNCPTATDTDNSEISEKQASGGWGSLDVVEEEQYQTNSKNTTTQAGKFTRTSVTIDNSCTISQQRATKGIRFYPFGRSFYHRAESLLDSILFAELKEFARSRVTDTLGNSQADKTKEKVFGKRNMPPDGNSNTKWTGDNQGGNLPPGGSTKNQNKSGNDGLNKDRDDMAEYGNPEAVSKRQRNTSRYLDTGEFEPLGKKVNVEGRGADLRARYDVERERQQSYSVLKWNFEALRANEKTSKSQEVKPKLPDGKRAPPSEMKQNRVIRQLEVHPDYISNDGITMSMAAVTLQHQREIKDRYKSHISGFATGRQNFLDDSLGAIQTHQSAYTSQNESRGGGSEANLGNYHFGLS
ncbi:uncharacterized protein FSUBG_13704 [Fusarium subglutinans]|uniref:Uncharacterized protein n=1 Tax=Gibberella subglutinans TaxID=42677 RepID=A0A8H5NTQ2_GIBSU|nr:uncharacterized protein FSUBG_13704 [Fusarium subglutinans]KAF5578871.1 hypothetical protein FSUBG_13704 [Fusarium subglutinans]